MTVQAGQIVAAVIAMQGRYGKALTAKVLVGARDERIRARGLDQLSAFGCLHAEGEENVRRMIDELIADDVLTVTDGEYPLLRAGARAAETLRGDEPIHITLPAPGSAQEACTRRSASVDRALLSRLTAVRRRIAEEQHVPPFVIFTNATLRDMADKRPRTRAAMLRVAGVGERKLERYGETFLREIEAYVND